MKKFIVRFLPVAIILLMVLPGVAFAQSSQITQLPGWPVSVGASEYFSDRAGLVLANIDDDPELEVIFGSSGEKLWGWEYDGTEIFSVPLSGLAQVVPSVGDVVGDDAVEIVVTTRDASGGTPTPKVYVFDNSGSQLYSSTGPNGGSLGTTPTLADVSGDEKMELVIAERGNSQGWVHLLNGDLSSVNKGWPVTLDHVPATSAAVGDIDNDGEKEITICSFTSIYAMEADGTLMTGFPVSFTDETFSYGSPALADLDGNGTLEIILSTHGDVNSVHAIQYDGTELPGWPYDLGDAWSFSPPSVGDIDSNGDLEVVAGRAGGIYEDFGLFVINHDGTDFGDFPYLMEGGAEGSVVLADILGDSHLEIIFTNNLIDGGLGFLFAIDSKGELQSGWPLRPDGMTYLNGASLADANKDGIPDIGVVGVWEGTASITLFSSSDFSFGPGGVHWANYQADIAHTGIYKPAYPGDDDDNTDDDDSVDDDETTDDDDTADDDSGGNNDDDENDNSSDDDTEECCG